MYKPPDRRAEPVTPAIDAPPGDPVARTQRRISQVRLGTGLAGIVGLLVLLLVSIVLSLCIGSGTVPLSDVWQGVFSPDRAVEGQLIMQELRIPRTVAGLLAGTALGLAGAVIQGVTRNPLADPGLLGINAGAAAAVVFALGWLGLTSPNVYIWFGFVGAALAATVVYGIGSLGREGATPVKLALAGQATSAALLALTTAMLLKDTETYDRYRFWQVGSLIGRDTTVLWQAAPFVGAGVLLALALGPQLNALALGDDVARGLGQKVGTIRVVSAVAVVLLTGGATVIAGPIAFVGLVVPHAARMLAGADYRWLIPYSLLLAPSLLLISDVIGRLLARPAELQVGIVTAAVGAIPFILLVRRRKMAEL
ncbi:FecCD family ABC transporter permease [Kineosporia babensis]|uniref:FecCD family ABC transporter permease n=1 Tax=Kineosporia babensis TaxID=499548 RepID=UPI0038B29811